MRKTPKRGVNWVFKIFFNTTNSSTIEANIKRIELENSNSDFIVIRHFLAYVHSSQSPNRVRVPYLETSTKLLISFTFGLWL